MQLICAFVFAYAKSGFSHDAAHIVLLFIVLIVSTMSLQIWDRNTLECIQVLTGHTGSVLCLQYDNNIIISGSSDSTVR